jgi:choline-sulfatase
MPSRRRTLRLACALAACLAFALTSGTGCGGGRGDSSVGEAHANVLLIVVDTLRRDHVGLYGQTRPTTPEIDRFAQGAVVFDHAYSTAPWTRPSVASILTGLYPSGHRAMALNNVLSPDVETLAEYFTRAGYATAGIVSHVILSERFGFSQGFTLWDEEEAQGHNHVSTPGVTRRALAALDALTAEDRPFFLFVHYFDPHYTYLAHPEIGFEPTTSPDLKGGEDIETLRARRASLVPADLDFLRARYDEEIRFTDAGIGRLLEGLERAGVADRTVVAITADHGEEFMERGWLGHTRTLYQELVAVPLVVRGRAGAPGHGQHVIRPVSLVSLTPTLLELAGVDAGDALFEGPSLAPFVRGGTPPRAGNVFAEVDFRGPVAKQARKKAVIGPRFKLIRDDRHGRVELYDLLNDPGERSNLARGGANPAVDALQRELYAFTTRELPPLTGAGEEVPIDTELRERLRQLGYVQSEATEAGEAKEPGETTPSPAP